MGKLVCRCGHVMDTTPSPEPDLWIAIQDADREWFVRAEAEAERLSDDYAQNREIVQELDEVACAIYTQIYNCPACNRLYWFRGEDGSCEVFAPESPPA